MRKNSLVFLSLCLFQAILPVFGAYSSTSRSPSVEKESFEWVDQNGHTASWWGQKIADWKEKKKEAEELLSQAEEALSAIAFQNKTLLEELEGEVRLRREIEQHKKAIIDADTMIEIILPEDARRAGAPPGWLR